MFSLKNKKMSCSDRLIPISFAANACDRFIDKEIIFVVVLGKFAFHFTKTQCCLHLLDWSHRI